MKLAVEWAEAGDWKDGDTFRVGIYPEGDTTGDSADELIGEHVTA